eukprot:CAMPEP_0185024962 /NCGR_PEP_ID=MMETSP1103-20130426/8109_1 /TAXON_ID=36769 /ORGANISM="Paraphysomonas bandaiensis, Strain Caron Lab Isolate" /LENGTH=588 /DNA_ID=CAMNT_0027558063 /DNA_START=257 /DNA_END=2023 /DNA_ORIENTATION=+
MTFKDFGKEVDKFRGVLAKHNIGANDKISLISNNRVEWATAVYAANSLGAQLVPMYEAQAEKDWKYIIQDSESKMVLVATEQIYEKTESYVNKFGHVESVLCFDSSDEYMHSYKRWMNMVEDADIPEAVIPSKDDLTCIIYTSGTTGNPKGVNLSHHNIVSNLYGLKHLQAHNLEKQNVSLCFLPWSHVYGLTCELHAFVAQGSTLALCPNREELLEAFAIVKPNMLMSVPALFNKIYDGVHTKVAAAPPIRQKLFHGAMAIARERNHNLEFHKPVSAWLDFKHKLADKLVLSKIRQVLGGNLEFIASGGAATNVKVIQFFEDIGVPILEGYGLTETSPVITASAESWDKRRLGCVGVPLYNVTVKILDPATGEEVGPGEEGEVCAAGDSIMTGYRNNEEANKEVFTYIDGTKYFRTGDLGVMVDNKFLKITGRIKELYKLENGKYVTPVPLEDTICRSQFIAQCVVYGAGQKHNVALVVPDFVQLQEWVKKQGIPIDGDIASTEVQANLMKSDSVIKLITSELISAGSAMKGYERVKRWAPVIEPFTQENNMLTPKMSLRRNNIVKAYQGLLDDMYSESTGTHAVQH